MNIHRLTLTAASVLIAACTSPPKPPTVDDSKKRPVNISQAVELQACRTELTATQIVLTETLTTPQRRQALELTPAAPARADAPPVPNQVFVINFPLGSADFNVPADESARLVDHARAAEFILIRGRTDATSDSMSETRLAQRRAEAAYKYLVDLMRLPPEGIRMSWQGAGDPMQPGGTAIDKQANRRVEIELYRVKPEVEVLPVLRDLRPLPGQAARRESSDHRSHHAR